MVQLKCSQNPKALEEIIRRWDRRVTSFLVKACGDYDAAQDLRQEVFLRVYRYAHSYDPRFSFASWLFRIAGNVLKTWWRRHNNIETMEEPLDENVAESLLRDPAPDPRIQAHGREFESRLRSAISRMNPSQRELLLYRLDMDLTYREIAQIIGAPETTVKSRVYAIIEQLRRTLEHSENL